MKPLVSEDLVLSGLVAFALVIGLILVGLALRWLVQRLAAPGNFIKDSPWDDPRDVQRLLSLIHI